MIMNHEVNTLNLKQGIYLQPIVDAKSKSVFAYEVLTRWECRGQVFSASDFGSENVSWGFVDPITIDKIEKAHEIVNSKRLFLNLSNETLSNDNFFLAWLSKVNNLTTLYEVYIEINEDVTNCNLSRRWPLLDVNGLRMIMDDLGFGYSSYERLSEYPWFGCKFDARRVLRGLDSEALYSCEKRNVFTVIEFVESERVSNEVLELGHMFHQGFFREGILVFDGAGGCFSCNTNNSLNIKSVEGPTHEAVC